MRSTSWAWSIAPAKTRDTVPTRKAKPQTREISRLKA